MQKFSNYVCPGATISWAELGGYVIKATIVSDDSSHPDDYECYSEENIQAWKRDEWWYCGLVLSVEKNGIMLTKHAASLWGIEANFPGTDNSILTETAQELCSEAMQSAKIEEQRIIKALME
jgi:hypothetical protein